jgi:hypothetical protein
MPKREYTIDWMLKNYMSFFQEFGMDETNIRHNFPIWSKNRPPLVKDYLWYIFQLLLIESAKQSMGEQALLLNQRKIYATMLDFRRRIEHKPANEILQLMLKADVRRNQLESSVKYKVVIISGNCCPYCNSLNEKQFEFEEVLANQYLGSIHCTRERGCICAYGYEALRDKNSRLIFK